MESRLGTPLADVRIHTDSSAAAAAAQANARAITIGADIFFGAGRFAPHTTEGATRVAHELVHVEQQRNGQRACKRSECRTRSPRTQRGGSRRCTGQRAQRRAAGHAA